MAAAEEARREAAMDIAAIAKDACVMCSIAFLGTAKGVADLEARCEDALRMCEQAARRSRQQGKLLDAPDLVAQAIREARDSILKGEGLAGG